MDSNGETIVPTINNSIAAIRIIMRLEGWESEKRKGKPSENLELGYVGEKRATHDLPASHRRGERQFAQTKFAQYNTDNNTNNHNEGELSNEGELLTYSALADFAPTPAQHHFAQTKFSQCNTDNNNDYDKYDDEYTEGKSLTYSALADFAPTPAQHQYPQSNTAYNNYPSQACACLVAPSPSQRGLGERNSTAGASLQLVPQENLLSFTRHTLPSFAPAPFHIAYYEVLTRFAMGEIKKLMITMPPQHGKAAPTWQE